MSELGPPQLQRPTVDTDVRIATRRPFYWLPIALLLAGAAQLAVVFALPGLINYLDPSSADDGVAWPVYLVSIAIFTLAILVLGSMALAVSWWPFKILAVVIIAAPIVEIVLFFQSLSGMVVP
jgi:hypothetical protein